MAHLPQDGAEIAGDLSAERRSQARPDIAGVDGHAASLSPATATSSASASGVSLVRVRSPAGLSDKLITPSGNKAVCRADTLRAHKRPAPMSW